MTNATDFLRLLEPAIRPVDPVVRRLQESGKPFEEKSFEELLAQSQQQDPRQDAVGQAATGLVAEESKRVDPLAPLSGLSQVHNQSLRDLIAQQHAGSPNDSTQEGS